MNNFIFENPTKVYFGRGCVREFLKAELASYGSSVMVISNPECVCSRKATEEVGMLLSALDYRSICFPFCGNLPTLDKVNEGISLVPSNDISLILAVGGNSVASLAKAISIGCVYEGSLWNDFFLHPGVLGFTPLPVAVITTGIDGSSALNGSAVLLGEKQIVKTSRDYPASNPRFAMADSAFNDSLSREELVEDGFALFTRLLLSYISLPSCGNVSDDLALSLLKGVRRDLQQLLYDTEDSTSKSNLMWSSMIAGGRLPSLGKSIDAEFMTLLLQLEADTDCTFAEASAVALPLFLRHLLPERRGKLEALSSVFSCEADDIITALIAFIDELGLPFSLRELCRDELPEPEKLIGKCGFSSCSCHRLNRNEMLEIIKECY